MLQDIPVEVLQRLNTRPHVLVIGEVGDRFDHDSDLATIQRYRELSYRHIAQLLAAGAVDSIVATRRHPLLETILATYSVAGGVVTVSDTPVVEREAIVLGAVHQPVGARAWWAIGANDWTSVATVCGRLHFALKRLRHDAGAARQSHRGPGFVATDMASQWSERARQQANRALLGGAMSAAG